MNLVTGGTGLVGSHILIELLKNDEGVRAIKRQNSDLKIVKSIFNHYGQDHLFSKIEWVDADILDIPSLENAMQDVSYIYHSAAIVSYKKKHYNEMYEVNINGTANLVNSAIANGVKKIGHISSVAALGENKSNYYNEENKWNNNKKNSYYAITKLGAEREIWRGVQEGIQAVIVNPGIIFGPSNWYRSSTSIFRKVHNGLKFYPIGTNGFVDVRDVSKGIIQLVNSDIHSERYIMVSENLPFKEVFHEIAKALKKDPPIKKANNWIVQSTWIVEKIRSIITGKSPSVNRQTALISIKEYNYDSSKIITALNFKFNSIKSAVENTSKFLLKR